MKVNLVIAAWGGSRRNEKPEYLGLCPHGDTNYILKQIACLRKYRQNLAQVTFACSPARHLRKEYLDGLASLPSEINNTKIEVLDLPRNLSSYGAWLQAVQVYREQFDYYLFVEDDYVFVRDNFDSILVDMYVQKRKQGCDYLLSYIEDSQETWRNGLPDGAIVTNGIISTIALKKRNYIFPASMEKFIRGFRIQMFDAPYRLSPYFSNKGIIYFGEGEFLIVPTQMVSPTGEVTTPEGRIVYSEIADKKQFINNLH